MDKRLTSGAISLSFLISPALAVDDASAGGIAAIIVLIIFALLVNLRPKRMVMQKIRRMNELRGPEVRLASAKIASEAVRKAIRGRKKRAKTKRKKAKKKKRRKKR